MRLSQPLENLSPAAEVFKNHAAGLVRLGIFPTNVPYHYNQICEELESQWCTLLAALESFASFNLQGKLTHRDTKHALQSPNVVEPTKFHLVGIGFLRLRHVYLFGKPTSARRESVARQAEAEEASEPSDDSDDETRAPSPDPNDATDCERRERPERSGCGSPFVAQRPHRLSPLQPPLHCQQDRHLAWQRCLAHIVYGCLLIL